VRPSCENISQLEDRRFKMEEREECLGKVLAFRCRMSRSEQDGHPIVRGVVAIPSRIAQGCIREAGLPQNSPQPATLRFTSCSSKRAARTDSGSRSVGWICGDCGESPWRASPKGLRRQVRASFETRTLFTTVPAITLNSPDVQKGRPK